jgi:hypothetical protein
MFKLTRFIYLFIIFHYFSYSENSLKTKKNIVNNDRIEIDLDSEWTNGCHSAIILRSNAVNYTICHKSNAILLSYWFSS